MAEEEGAQPIGKMTFEEALEELKRIVGRLESGEGRLDEAIEAYERGARLKAHCEQKLREAQARIEQIGLSANGQPKVEPFEEG